MLYDVQPYVYVIKCLAYNKYYVGSTFRTFWKRMQEHKTKGCRWTTRHGFGRVVAKIPSTRGTMSQLENEVWMHYARIYGPERVRGGDVTIVRRQDDGIPDWLLPEEFGGTRLVDWGITA